MGALMACRGLFRRFRSFVLRTEVQVVGRCKLCGECCREVMLMDDGKWIYTRAQFTRLIMDKSDYERFEPVGGGGSSPIRFTCTNLGEDNLCVDHEFRPGVCRAYPTVGLYYRGGELLSFCGYKYVHVTFRQTLRWFFKGKGPDFRDVLGQELEREKKDKGS